MTNLFSGKVVLVVGGSEGIGKAAAAGFAAEGARVALVGRFPEKGAVAMAAIHDAGGEAHYIQADTTDETAIRAAVRETVTTFGRLDVAFNNAGYEGPSHPLAEQTADSFDRIMDVNLRGCYLAMKYELRQMLDQGGGGAIVNTSSIAGIVGMPQGALYAASKHGLIGLSKSAALEYAPHNIRINIISPAATDTPMLDRYIASHPGFGSGEEAKQRFAERYPLGRIATAEEVAQAALWLASAHASFITGANLVIDGGITLG